MGYTDVDLRNLLKSTVGESSRLGGDAAALLSGELGEYVADVVTAAAGEDGEDPVDVAAVGAERVPPAELVALPTRTTARLVEEATGREPTDDAATVLAYHAGQYAALVAREAAATAAADDRVTVRERDVETTLRLLAPPEP